MIIYLEDINTSYVYLLLLFEDQGFFGHTTSTDV